MGAGAAASARAWLRRWQWDEVNIHTGIMLDWDDVQAVATRLAPVPDGSNHGLDGMEGLLGAYREQGATHLSMPELTLNRLLQAGRLSLTQGPAPDRVYMRARDAALADLVTAELQARLPHLQPSRSRAKHPLISFKGDLPTVAEVGLGFDPAQADLARRAGLGPVARPVGYSWVQPAMIDRTLNQAAVLDLDRAKGDITGLRYGEITDHDSDIAGDGEIVTGAGVDSEAAVCAGNSPGNGQGDCGRDASRT